MSDTDVKALLRSLNFVGDESGGVPDTLNLHEIFAEKEKAKEVAPEWHMCHMPHGEKAGGVEVENRLLRQRVVSLENENNELKKQLARYAAATTPPPKHHPEALQMSPLLARCTTPTTPPSNLNGHLSPSAPSFIPIQGLTNPATHSPTAHLSQSAYALAPAMPPQQPGTTSPGKSMVTNVCRHWLVNRCTYGNDCRFVHPPQEHSGLHKMPAAPMGVAKKTLKDEDVLPRASPIRQLIPQGVQGRPNELVGFDATFADKSPEDFFKPQPMLYTVSSTTA